MNYYIVINRNAFCENIKKFIVKANKMREKVKDGIRRPFFII